MATTVALIGLNYLTYHHTVDMNITPHVYEGLEAIRAYIACALLARVAKQAARFGQHLVFVHTVILNGFSAGKSFGP